MRVKIYLVNFYPYSKRESHDNGILFLKFINFKNKLDYCICFANTEYNNYKILSKLWRIKMQNKNALDCEWPDTNSKDFQTMYSQWKDVLDKYQSYELALSKNSNSNKANSCRTKQ